MPMAEQVKQTITEASQRTTAIMSAAERLSEVKGELRIIHGWLERQADRHFGPVPANPSSEEGGEALMGDAALLHAEIDHVFGEMARIRDQVSRLDEL